MGVSLRLVMSLIIASVTIIATLISFIPIYVSGVDGVRGALSDLRSAYVSQAYDQTNTFFRRPITLLSEIQQQVARGVTPTPTNNSAWASYLYHLATTYGDIMNTAAVLLPDPSSPLGWKFIHADTRFRWITGEFFFIETNGTATVIRSYNATGGVKPPIEDVFPFNMALLWTWTPLSLIATDPTFRLGWKPAATGYDSAQITAAATLVDPQGNFVGAMQADILAARTGEFLRSLGLRSRARGIAVDVNTGIVLGVSTNASLSHLNFPAYLDITLLPWDRLSLTTLSNVSDPLVVEVIGLEGANNLLTASLPYSKTITTQYGGTYLDVLEVQDLGLHIRVILMMPEKDFLEDFQKTQTNTIIGVVCAIVAMVVLAGVLGHVMTIPFVRLAERMELTASLQDDGTTDPPSFLSEVQGMQASYEMMRGELEKMKSYLPQSVLALLRGDSDEEDEEDIEGDVSMAISSQGSGSGSRSAGLTQRQVRDSEAGSTRSSSAVPAAGKLFTSLSLSAKRISVAMFNLRGFHTFCGSSNAAEITNLQKNLLGAIFKNITEQRGVVDFFQGDHVQVSFNAVTHCANHGKRAAVSALNTLKSIQDLNCGLELSAAIHSGMCHVGNLGIDGLRRFCIVGQVISQAAILERATRLFRCNILFPSNMFTDLRLETLYQCVGLLRLSDQGKPKVVASLVGTKSMQGDEWMYQLKEGEDADPYMNLNEAYSHLSEGNVTAAKTHLDKELAKPSGEEGKENAEGHKGLAELQRLITVAESGSGGIVTSTERFFEQCLLADTTGGPLTS